MNKYQYSTNTIYYQQARVFRKSGDNAIAYCLEPFTFFDESKTYTPTVNPRNLSKAQIDRISKIAHFGLGYKTHYTMIWYAITQMMIWQTADTSGDYYFTDGLNGNRINPYQSEMQEINDLIKQYEVLPSFNNQTYTVVAGKKLVIEDKNKVIDNFKSNEITTNDNKITLNNIKAGEYNYTFTKQDNYYNKPIIFYQANGSQNLVDQGNLSDLRASVKVKAISTKLEISKIDQDTKSTTPAGEASLDGATYKLYDSYNKLIDTITIKNNQALINNLDFGKYYLIEDNPGTGYTLDTNKYEVNITPEKPTTQLVLTNKVIEKKVIIEKKYGEDNTFMQEKDIGFSIIDSNNEIIKTIITNEDGLAEITLPYGKYTISQVNSTEGYSKIEPFTIEVTDQDPLKIDLKDLRIPVPDTHITTEEKISKASIIRIPVPNTHTSNNPFILIIEILLIIL